MQKREQKVKLRNGISLYFYYKQKQSPGLQLYLKRDSGTGVFL